MRRAPLIAFVAVLLVARGCRSGVPDQAARGDRLHAVGVHRRDRAARRPGPGARRAPTRSCSPPTRHRALRRHGAAGATTAAPPLEVRASGDRPSRYRNDYRAAARVAGGWRARGSSTCRSTPPGKDTFGSLCVRNLGKQPRSTSSAATTAAPTRARRCASTATRPRSSCSCGCWSPAATACSRGSGRTTAHAATLKPFGAWWLWVLALALLTLGAARGLAALRSALAPTAARAPTRDVAPRACSTRARRAPGSSAFPAGRCVAAAGALTCCGSATGALSTHVFQNDEDQYVYLSRWLQARLPRARCSTSTLYGRGLQRLEVWLLAIPAALFDSPVVAARRAHPQHARVRLDRDPGLPARPRGMALRPHWAALPAVAERSPCRGRS